MSLRMAVVAAAGLLFASVASPVKADVLVTVDKDAQRMTVTVDGVQKYSWLVSSGLGGGPYSGDYKPEFLARSWFSRIFNNAPMPYSIFFDGHYAIHGTTSIAKLGERASMGCVRLHPENAAVLYDLVVKNLDKTRIIVANDAAQIASILAGDKTVRRPTYNRAPVVANTPAPASIFDTPRPASPARRVSQAPAAPVATPASFAVQ